MDPCGDGVEVPAERVGEALHWRRGVLLGLADPLRKKVSASVADEIGDVRAKSQARAMSGQASRT
ncbi:hypothetical protein ACFTXM_17795 [Streptomyces sp. NPDC056930]|uniref:hypothetical protein n=1 Tax=Streptomyces sp. NPDC056930 TaxID=3345967 RepID=UPI00363E80DE